MRKNHFVSCNLMSSAAAAAIMVACATPALAQEAAQLPSEAAPTSDESAPVDGGEITVTGTRLGGSSIGTPTTVTTLSTDSLATLAPASISQALNKLPQFSGSTNPRQTNSGGGNTLGASQGELLNLRGLGTNRTLVLLNGVRLPPTQPNGAVDVSILPTAFLQRVDVVTGGASAAYGSDAVVGVVNYVLNTRFTGLKITAQTGLSSRGDDFGYKFSLAGGLSFGADERGHILASIERSEESGIGTQQARDHWDLVRGGAGTAANPYMTYADGRYAGFPPGGSPVAAAADQALLGSGFSKGFLPGGTLYTRQPGLSTNNALVQSGGDGQYVSDEVLIPDVRTDNYFARVSYDVTPDITPYFQVNYSERRTDSRAIIQSSQAGANFAINIQPGNAFLAPAIRNAFGSNFTLQRGGMDFPLQVSDTKGTAFMAQGGIVGGFGSNWKWDINYVYGKNIVTALTRAEEQTPRMVAAADAVFDPNGNIVCRVSLTNPGLYPGCVPINLFGQGQASLAAVNYVLGGAPAMVRVTNEMKSGSINLRGTLLHNWAGDIRVAVGGEIRKQSLDQTTNANVAVPPSTLGLPAAPRGMLSYYLTNYGLASGSVTVKEGYGEILVPLLADVPLVQSLNVNGAIRYTHYSTSGGVTTWKVGMSYKPINDLSIRTAYSNDIRAPSLSELFQGVSQSLATATDPRTGTATTISVFTKGNPNLKPESARSFTAGFTYSPSWSHGLTLSLDYYHLKFKDVIFAPTFAQILQTCENSKPAYNAPECGLVTRDPTTPNNIVTAVNAVPLNQANRTVKGIDLSLDFQTDASRIIPGMKGTLGIGGNAAYLSSDKSQNAPGAVLIQNDGFGVQPHWKGSIYVSYNNDRFGVTINNRFTGKVNRAQPGVNEIYADNQYWDNRVYTDLALTYKLTPGATAFLNIDNLFDVAQPALGSSNQPGLNFYGNRAIYDILGTYVTAGIRVSLDGSVFENDSHETQRSGVYTSLAGGAAFVHGGNAKLKQPLNVSGYAAAPVVDTHISFKTGNSTQAALGYRWQSGLRAELELNLQNASVSQFNGTSATGRQSSNGLMLNALYDIMPNATLTPFVGVGAGLERVEWKHVTQAADPTFDGAQWSFKWQLIAGAKMRVSNHLDLFAKYQYAQSGTNTFYSKPFTPAYDIGARVSDYKSKSSLLTAGVAYAF